MSFIDGSESPTPHAIKLVRRNVRLQNRVLSLHGLDAGGADLFLLQLRAPVQDDVHLRRTALVLRLFETDKMLASKGTVTSACATSSTCSAPLDKADNKKNKKPPCAQGGCGKKFGMRQKNRS